MDIYYVVIECPNTGRATRTGLELSELAAFDFVALLPQTCTCQQCHETHTWSRKDAWLERHPASRLRVRAAVARLPPKS